MTEGPAQGSSVELGRYFQILGRRWLTVVICTALGAGLGLAYLAVKPQRATASALVYLNVVTATPFTNTREPSGLLDPQTEVQTARSAQVLTRAATDVGDVTASDLRSALRVELLSDATVVRITYEADSQDKAVAGADAVAKEYLAYRGQLAEDKITNINARLNQQRNDLRDQLQAANTRLAKAKPGSPAAIQADSDRQVINLELDSLLTQINSVGGIDTSGGSVLTAAAQSPVYLTPSKTLVVGTGLVVGFLIGLVLAFVRNYQDRRTFDAADVVAAGAGPFLGSAPAAGRRGSALDPAPLETVRGVRERLLASVPTEHSSLALLDLDGDASSLPLALAVTMAESGQTVDVMMAGYSDKEFQRISADFELEPAEQVDGVTRHTSTRFPELQTFLVPEADGRKSAATLLGEVVPRSGSDLRLVAVAPSASESLRLAAARLAGVAIAVVRRRKTKVARLRELTGEVRAVGARMQGTILAARR